MCFLTIEPFVTPNGQSLTALLRRGCCDSLGYRCAKPVAAFCCASEQFQITEAKGRVARLGVRPQWAVGTQIARTQYLGRLREAARRAVLA
jgi:hypothetical protein